MNLKDFVLTALAVAIGGLIAGAIAGYYLKQQVSAATAGNTTLGTILSLFAPKS